MGPRELRKLQYLPRRLCTVWHSLGLPPLVFKPGAMDDVSYLSDNRNALNKSRATTLHTLLEQDLLDSLEPATTPSLILIRCYS